MENEKKFRYFWIYLGATGLAVAGLLAYLIFIRPKTVEPVLAGDIELSLSAPESLPAGSEISYEILVKNLANTRLTNLAMELFYPRGFSPIFFSPAGPKDFNSRTLSLPDLEPSEDYKLSVVGRLEGTPAEIKTFAAKVHYTPENFRSAFAAEKSVETEIITPEIDLKLKGPPHVITGQILTYEIELKNFSEESFSGLLVRATYPGKFVFSSAAPAPAREQREWAIDFLPASASQTLIISGKLTAEPGREAMMEAELLAKKDNGETISLGKSFAFTYVRPSPLVLRHQLPDYDSAKEYLPGMNLNYRIEYENVSDIGLSNVVIAVVFETAVFDFSKIRGNKGQVSSLGGKRIIWVPAGAAELLAVKPGQAGWFDFSIPISANLTAELKKNPKATTRVEFTSREITEAIAGNSMEVPISTQVNLKSKVEILSGSNPPILGSATGYRVELELTNTVNDAEGMVEAVIPRAETVFDVNSVAPSDEAANLEFIPISGILRWRLNKVFALTGSFHAPRKISFLLTATPTISDSDPGNVLLLRDVQFTGTDLFTKKPVRSNRIERVD